MDVRAFVLQAGGELEQIQFVLGRLSLMMVN